MLTLHGFAFSNYHNIVKHALLYKGIAFEEHKVYPGDPQLQAVSPAGKVPALTTADGVNLSESSVMLDYLEDAYPEKPLYPADPGQRARVRQLMKVTELYLELPARRMIGSVFSRAPAPDELKAEVRATLERGVGAINALATFSPYALGAELTAADLYLRYALAIPKMIGPAQLDWDIVASIDGLAAWDAMMADTDIARKIDADQAQNTPEFMARLKQSA